LVCTELIYKAYEPTLAKKGSILRWQDYLGHLLLPANDIAKQVDEQYGSDKQQA